MAKEKDDGAVSRRIAAAAGSSNLCSIPEDGDLVSFAASSPGPASPPPPPPPPPDFLLPPPSRRRGGGGGGRARRRRRESDGAPDEERIFHRSPVSLENGYKPAAGFDVARQSTPPPDVERDDSLGAREEGRTAACHVAAVLGAIVAVCAALFAIGTLLLRNSLWS